MGRGRVEDSSDDESELVHLDRRSALQLPSRASACMHCGYD